MDKNESPSNEPHRCPGKCSEACGAANGCGRSEPASSSRILAIVAIPVTFIVVIATVMLMRG